MSRKDIERVLANWIREAQSPTGRLAEGADPAVWAAERFIEWWRTEVEELLDEGDNAVSRLRDGISGVLNWDEHGEALHELTHVQDAFGDLRQALGLDEAPQ